MKTNKGKMDKWLTESNLNLLKGWAGRGLTDEQIAHNMGIHVSTLYVYKNKSKEIDNALKKSKEVVDFEVENALFKRAMGYTIQIEEEKLDKDGCVHKLKRDVHIPPDTLAQIFWLKNRQRDQWREKIEVTNNPQQLNKVQQLLDKIKEEANNDTK